MKVTGLSEEWPIELDVCWTLGTAFKLPDGTVRVFANLAAAYNDYIHPFPGAAEMGRVTWSAETDTPASTWRLDTRARAGANSIALTSASPA